MRNILKTLWNALVYVSILYLFTNGIIEFLDTICENDSEENDLVLILFTIVKGFLEFSKNPYFLYFFTLLNI